MITKINRIELKHLHEIWIKSWLKKV